MPRSLPFRDYQAIDAVNGSTLFEARRSWKHYDHALRHPRAESPTMALGTATHVAVLEPDEFPRRYFVLDDEEIERIAPPRNKSAGIKTWKEYRDRHPEQPVKVTTGEYQRLLLTEAFPGKIALSSADYDRCVGMRRSVESHPIAAPLLDMGQPEQVIEWVEHVKHGLGTVAVKCKGRLDWRRAPRVFVDLKSTRAPTAHAFLGQSWSLGTFHKMAWYRRGLATIEGCSREAIQAWVIGVENNAPHDVYPVEMMPGREERRGLDGIDDKIDELLEGLVKCRATSHYPGAHEDKPIEGYPPAYAFGGMGDIEILTPDEADREPLDMEA